LADFFWAIRVKEVSGGLGAFLSVVVRISHGGGWCSAYLEIAFLGGVI
jgi:hypothetical protein